MDGGLFQYLLWRGGVLGLTINIMCHLMVAFIWELNITRHIFYNILYLFLNKESRYWKTVWGFRFTADVPLWNINKSTILYLGCLQNWHVFDSSLGRLSWQITCFSLGSACECKKGMQHIQYVHMYVYRAVLRQWSAMGKLWTWSSLCSIILNEVS
jgi:hypothetical protein